MKEKKTALNKILSAIGIALCVVFGLMLAFNITIIIKGLVNPDTPPTVFGLAPLIVKSGSMSSDVVHRLNSSEIVDMTEEQIKALKPGDKADSMMGDLRLTNVIQSVNTPDEGEIYFFVERPASDHIEVGDLIFSKTTDTSTLKVGDIISFMEGKSVVTHRIIGISNENGLAFVTKGDANNAQDTDPVPADKVVGVYKGRVPVLGDFIFFLQKPLGMAIFIGVPVVAFIAFDIIRRQRSAKKGDKKQDEMEKELERLRAIAKEQEEKKAASANSEKAELEAELERLRAAAKKKQEEKEKAELMAELERLRAEVGEKKD